MKNIIKYVFGSCVTFVFMAVFLMPAHAEAALPPGFQIDTLATGLNKPTTMAFVPDGRIFIAEKEGTVRVFKNGALLPTPLITLSRVSTMGDHGIIGMAVDPNFAQNGYVYLSYTYDNSPENYWGQKTARIARITVVGDTASESSMVVIVGKITGSSSQPSCDYFPINADCMPSDSPSHSAGGLRFGPDGKLYATIGDGAGFETMDPRAMKALNLDNLAGKLLRINTDGTGVSDNPFYTGNPNDNRSKVWAYGFRNSFRFNFRPSNNSIFAGDVGWRTWEEVNVVRKGGNYGWPCREGYIKEPEYNCTTTNYIDPIYVFDHSSGTAAVTGGAFPKNNAYPQQYMNDYFFGDVTNNTLSRMVVDAQDNFVSTEILTYNAMGASDILTGPDGMIYYLAIYNGELRKLNYVGTGNQPPVVTISATPLSGPSPLTVNFSSSGTYDPNGDTLSYAWNFGDGQTSNAQNPSHTYGANGNYTATLTVSDGKGGSTVKDVLIRVGSSNANNVIPSHVKTVVNPIPTYIGFDANITTSIKNTGASQPIIIDMEIYDANGTKVAQKLFEESIPTNTTKDFTFPWFPASIGNYRVAVGLFHQNWAGIYEWTNEAATLKIENRAPTTTPQPAFSPIVESVVANPTLVSVNQPFTITSGIRNNGGVGSGLIDVEIYKDGTKVYQNFYDNVLYAKNELKYFNDTFTPTTAGDYKISIGLFRPNWAGIYSWSQDVITVKATGGSTPTPSSIVFESSLAAGWENWSWDTTVSFTDKINVTFNSPWAGLYLHTNGLNTSGKNTLQFEVSGQAGDSAGMQLLIYGESGSVIGTKQLNGNQTYSIALTELNAANKVITGIALQGNSGVAPKPFSLDNVRFVQ